MPKTITENQAADSASPSDYERELFLRLVRNLLQVPALRLEDPRKDLRNFEERYCFHPELQKMYTQESLLLLTESLSDGIFYEIVDQFSISLTIFSFHGDSYLVGPYARQEYDEQSVESILLKNHLPASNKVSFKLYYTAIPVLFTNQLQETMNGLLFSFDPSIPPYRYSRLTGLSHPAEAAVLEPITDSTDYSTIYRRYDMEHFFMNMVRRGDVEHVLAAKGQMSQLGRTSNFVKPNDIYANIAVSSSILRVLVRKAAEESGLSVITINEITQKYVQKMSAAHTNAEIFQLQDQMILELTQAVRDFLRKTEGFSPASKKVAEYIDLHLGEEVSLPLLAEFAGLSESHLSREFKKDTGKSISSYIAQLRCKKAADLLRETNRPISEISSYVGYEDNNYFVKVFRKYYGLSPREYRAANS